MSGGSQHNPNGRQSQLGPGWSPLQLQVANFLARAPQAHMASDRAGVTWHTPTPPPHLYHVPAPSPPDPLQAMKNAAGNSVFRHTATPPELYRHTPTPPDKHILSRHTPSPGDAKVGSVIPPPDMFPHLGPARDKHVRPDELLYSRGGVDLSLSGRTTNGSPAPHGSPALSVRDAPTINSLIARAQPQPQPQPRHAHAHAHAHSRVDALLERLVPSPQSHSVIMHSRAAHPTPTPSPPSSNEDSADSCGAPPGSKRKRKPERTLRVPAPLPPTMPEVPPPPAPVHIPSRVSPPPPTPPATTTPTTPTTPAVAATPTVEPPKPIENGETPHEERNGPDPPEKARPPSPEHARRKTRGSSETIDDIAAMIASSDGDVPLEAPPDAPVSIDKLESVLASPEPKAEPEAKVSPPRTENKEQPPPEAIVETAAAPKRRSARTSNSESTNVPVESPSEAKPAEPEAEPSAEPTAASFVEVENQLEKMFAGIEEPSEAEPPVEKKAKKRRKSAPTKAERKPSRRSSRASEDGGRRKGRKLMGKAKKCKDGVTKGDAYDSGSNASSSRSRGPYIQIRGPRDSPLSVSVINASTGEDEAEGATCRRGKGEEFRNGLRARGLHASTLGLRYDATTPDLTWLCVFCERGPHASALGDLFGPYTVDTDCEEYRALDEATRRRYEGGAEVWFHEACAVWAPGLVAAGARLWGLAGAVWGARGTRCHHCSRQGAPLACSTRACPSRCHVPCAQPAGWHLRDDFQAVCPRHV